MENLNLCIIESHWIDGNEEKFSPKLVLRNGYSPLDKMELRELDMHEKFTRLGRYNTLLEAIKAGFAESGEHDVMLYVSSTYAQREIAQMHGLSTM